MWWPRGGVPGAPENSRATEVHPHQAPTAAAHTGLRAQRGEQRQSQNMTPETDPPPAPAKLPAAGREASRRTCEDGHAVEAAVQLAEQDGEEAVCGQHAGVPCALVIDHHVLRLRGLHLGAKRAEVTVAGHLPAAPPPAATAAAGRGMEGRGCRLGAPRGVGAGTQPQFTPGQV